ncbi:MAG: hypothetical protein LBD60_01990 [Puniceicoccales bacterium]|jgi:hypothetical protein|nr:hypothetical protein [Puniceicoccales bacterium]
MLRLPGGSLASLWDIFSCQCPQFLYHRAQKILSCDWDSEQYAVDDATIINAARKISGLNGGGLGNLIKAGKKAIEIVKEITNPNAIENAVKLSWAI